MRTAFSDFMTSAELLNIWQHAVATVDSSGNVSVELVGATVAGASTVSVDGIHDAFISDARTFVGGTRINTRFFDGLLDEVKISTLPSLLTADFDGDTDVDGFDFLTWQRGFGLAGQTNNSNGDGSVNSTDLGIWEGQFGGTQPLAVAVATSVPEPAASSLILAALLITTSCSQRQSRLGRTA